MAGRGDEALLRADVPAIFSVMAGLVRDKPGHDELRQRVGRTGRA